MSPSERERIAGRLANLQARARLLGELRRFFDERGFVEIEAPILVPSPGLELHLDAFAVKDAARTHYLITSPEYQMKRLLAGGMDKIYSLGKVFRRAELGPHHTPEFTMLEWYRANAGWEAIADDVEALIGACARALGREARLFERVTVAEAFGRWAGVRVEGDESVGELREKLERAGHRLPSGRAAWDDLFFQVFLDAIEPKLGWTILYDWPRPLAALAREKPGDPRVVERFEAYADGLELCNGFGELIDPVEQRRRCERDLEERRVRGLPAYPLDEKFLAALGQMAPSGGVALGVDRLAMLLLGAKDIRDVLAFKADEL